MPNRIAAGMEVPLNRGTSGLKKRLTFKYQPYGERKSKTHKCYRQDGKTLILPRQFGLEQFPPWEDCVEDFASVCKLPKHRSISHRGSYEYQKPWVAEVLAHFRRGAYDVVAQAATGKGKTVMALSIAQRLGWETVIIVDQDNLREQWIAAMAEHMKIDPKAVGTIGGGKRRESTCGFTVAMIQSLYDKIEETKEWSRQFGMAIIDECHTIGAPQFSQALFALDCRYRLAVSATPDRADALNKVLRWHLGEVLVKLAEEHHRSAVRVVETDACPSWYANISPKAGRYINELVEDPERNWLLVDIIGWFIQHDRQALILSDRIAHLQELEAALYVKGIATQDQIGLYTKEKGIWMYTKDPTPKRKPLHWEKGSEYTPVKLALVRKRQGKSELAAAKGRQIILATYRMFSKGVDEPRLDAGMDATPRSAFEQTHGRILRSNVRGKRKPVWVTLRDVKSYRAEHQFSIRLKELMASNVEVLQWDPKRQAVRHANGSSLADAAARRSRILRDAVIETGPDERNTLTMPTTGRSKSADSGTTTGGKAEARKRRIHPSRAADSSPEPRRKRYGSTNRKSDGSRKRRSTLFEKQRRRSTEVS